MEVRCLNGQPAYALSSGELAKLLIKVGYGIECGGRPRANVEYGQFLRRRQRASARQHVHDFPCSQVPIGQVDEPVSENVFIHAEVLIIGAAGSGWLDLSPESLALFRGLQLP